MSDFETEAEHDAYFEGFNTGMIDTVVLACDRVLSVLSWEDRQSVLSYLSTKLPPKDNNE